MDYTPNDLLQRLIGRRMYGVLFVMDYVQLWFDGDQEGSGDVTLTCYNFPLVRIEGKSWGEPDAGYADAVRSLIPSGVTATSELPGAGLVVSFSGGEIVVNPSWDELEGPEIAMLGGFVDGAWMVWRPGETSFEHLALAP